MKKWITILLVLLFSLSLTVFAQSPRLVDEAGLLTDEEFQQLSAQLNEVSQRWSMDVVIVTVNTLEGKTATAYADDYFDYNGYSADGILLLISMEDRDWAISTSGSGISTFTDAGQQYIMDDVLADLSLDYFYDAFSTFVSLCDDFCLQASTGTPYDNGNMPKEAYPFFAYLLVAVAIGFIVALIATGVMKGKLKSVRPQTAANNYLKQNSLQVTEARDIFLYHTVTRTAKPKQTTGSSTHTSSSGRTHGGSSGKF